MKHFLFSILLFISCCVFLFPQTTNEKSPEDIALEYMAALDNGAWDQIALLMHPEATASIRGFVEIIPDDAESQKVFYMIWGVSNKKQAEALSDDEIFAGFMNFADKAKGLSESMGSTETEILGKVFEGEDTCHVLCRIDTSVKGVPFRSVQVISMAKLPSGWGILLKSDLAIMIAALKERFASKHINSGGRNE